MTKIPSEPRPAQDNDLEREREEFAARVTSAMLKLPREDKAIVLEGILDPLPGAPCSTVDSALLSRGHKEAAEAIRRNQSSPELALHDFLGAMKTEGWSVPSHLVVATALAPFIAAVHATPDQMDQLARRLEVIQDLHGERDLANISDPKLRAAIRDLGSPELSELVRAAHLEMTALLDVKAER
jgi:hypothetical protein